MSPSSSATASGVLSSEPTPKGLHARFRSLGVGDLFVSERMVGCSVLDLSRRRNGVAFGVDRPGGEARVADGADVLVGRLGMGRCPGHRPAAARSPRSCRQSGDRRAQDSRGRRQPRAADAGRLSLRKQEESTMQSLAPSLPPVRTDAPEEIPVLDLAPYLAGEPGALQRLGAELRRAFEEIGFYFIVGHGVPQSLVEPPLRRGCTLPRPAARGQALAVRMDEYPGGLPAGARLDDAPLPRQINQPTHNKAHNVERGFLIFKGRRHARQQQVAGQPAGIPRDRGTRDQCRQWRKLAKFAMLLLYATALDLPAGHSTLPVRRASEGRCACRTIRKHDCARRTTNSRPGALYRYQLS